MHLSPIESSGLLGIKAKAPEGKSGSDFFDLIFQDALTSGGARGPVSNGRANNGASGTHLIQRCGGCAKDALVRFKNLLEDTGLPVTNFFLPERHLPLFKAFLQESGFSSERIEEVISKIPVKQGKYNIGKFLMALGDIESGSRSPGEWGIKFPGLPHLEKILFDLGLTAGEVMKVKEQILVRESSVSIRDLERMIRAQFKEKTRSGALRGAGIDEVKELLLRAGLSSGRIDRILSDMGIQGDQIQWEDFVELLERAWKYPRIKEDDDRPSRAQTMMEDLLQKVVLGREDPGQNSAFKVLFKTTPEDILQGLIDNNPSPEKWAKNAAFKDIESLRPKPEIGDNDFDMKSLFSPGKTLGDMRSNTLPSAAARKLVPQIIRPITKNMVFLVRNGEDKIKIELNPPHLGELEIDLVLRGRYLKATFTTHNFIVKHLLESNVQQLRQAFLDQGIHLQEFQVTVGYEAGPWEKRHYGEGQKQRSGWTAEPEETGGTVLDPLDNNMSPTIWTRGLSSVDLFI